MGALSVRECTEDFYAEAKNFAIFSADEQKLSVPSASGADGDSLVYATARRHRAKLVTGDADFEGLPNTIVIR